MTISPRTANMFGFFSMAVMLAMLGLMLFRAVPQSWFVTMTGFAIMLFLIRLTLRLVMARQDRIHEDELRKNRETDEHPHRKNGDPGAAGS